MFLGGRPRNIKNRNLANCDASGNSTHRGTSTAAAKALGLLGDDEETMIGSCFVLEADSLAEVEEFNRNDPFAKVGLWKSVSIRPFSKRVDNR